MRTTGRTLALSLALGLTAVMTASTATTAAASPVQEEAALGNGGELYLAKAGTFGELFPGKPGPDAATPVLAVDVLKPGGEKERLLVPETDGAEVELFPSLFVEEASGTVFLLWESRINVVHPILVLSGFDGDRWLDPISIVGTPFSPKTSPSFAVTRDTYQVAGEEGESVTRHRTVVHIVWGEENSAGVSRTFYTPIIFEGGIYQGESPVFCLNDFDTGDGLASPVEISGALAESPNIQGGSDGRTVIVGFASAITRRLTTLEIDVLPAQLAQVADGARAHIIDIGVRLFPGRIQTIADGARAHIIDIGHAYHPELAQILADRVFRLVMEGAPDLDSLGDKARAHIIDIGAKFSGRGLKPQIAEASSVGVRSVIREISTTAKPPQAIGGVPFHLIQFRVASQRPAPQIADAARVNLFLSQDGEDVLVAWPDADGKAVSYRDSHNARWNETRQLRLTDGIDLERAFKILEQKVRDR